MVISLQPSRLDFKMLLSFNLPPLREWGVQVGDTPAVRGFRGDHRWSCGRRHCQDPPGAAPQETHLLPMAGWEGARAGRRRSGCRRPGGPRSWRGEGRQRSRYVHPDTDVLGFSTLCSVAPPSGFLVSNKLLSFLFISLFCFSSSQEITVLLISSKLTVCVFGVLFFLSELFLNFTVFGPDVQLSAWIKNLCFLLSVKALCLCFMNKV